MRTKLMHCTLVTNGQPLQDQDVVIEDERIVSVGPGGHFASSCDNERNLHGAWVSPGFIDLQINGAGDALFLESPTVSTLETMATELRSRGITSFLPTLTASSIDTISCAMRAIEDFSSNDPHTVLGINLEGPFINESKAGMADPAHIGPFNRDLLTLLHEFEMPIFMTVAPESMSRENLKDLLGAAVTVSIGHTSANYTDSMKFFEAGVSVATHIFNAMTSIAGRDPGVVGAILDNDRVVTSFIADGYHVHPSNARLVYQLLGKNRIFIISDGMPSIGGAKAFNYGVHAITDTDGKCVTGDGVLAGTGVDVVQACRQFATWVGKSFRDVIPLISATPARALKLDNDYGVVQKGAVANLVVLDDENNIDSIYHHGCIVHA